MKKYALILGASGGIGSSISEKFIEDGYDIISISRKKPDCKSSNVVHIFGDAYESESLIKSLEQAKQISKEKIFIVVNCIGDILSNSLIKDINLDILQKTFQVNFFSSVIVAKSLFWEISTNKGCFVFISSIAKNKVYPYIADYCAAKSALSTFVKSLAVELAPYQARCVAISPAVVDTALFAKSKYTKEDAATWHRLSRIGSPTDIADLVSFLSSNKASWITGTDYVIDGGMLL